MDHSAVVGKASLAATHFINYIEGMYSHSGLTLAISCKVSSHLVPHLHSIIMDVLSPVEVADSTGIKG